VPVVDMILIALAGVAAGAINALVGSGTLVTFPTLVALGYPPVVSTMSNAIGLVAGGFSSTWGYRRELAGQWHRLRWQIPASFVGAAMGAWLLLHLPEKVFTQVVPVLLIAALILVVIGPRIQNWARRRAEEAGRSADHVSPRRMAALVFATFAIGIYGGYFGGGQLAYPTSNDPLFQADTPAMSYREPMRASPAAPADRAVLALQVPADAKIWVQGEATKQDGAVRTFVSPPLEPGKTYTYAVKAQWTENGKPVEQSQNVTVRAGNRSQLLFLPRGS